MGEVGGRGWKFFDTRPCAKDEYFRAHQEKIGSHPYIDPRRFYEVFLVSDFKAEWMICRSIIRYLQIDVML